MVWYLLFCYGTLLLCPFFAGGGAPKTVNFFFRNSFNVFLLKICFAASMKSSDPHVLYLSILHFHVVYSFCIQWKSCIPRLLQFICCVLASENLIWVNFWRAHISVKRMRTKKEQESTHAMSACLVILFQPAHLDVSKKLNSHPDIIIVIQTK